MEHVNRVGPTLDIPPKIVWPFAVYLMNFHYRACTLYTDIMLYTEIGRVLAKYKKYTRKYLFVFFLQAAFLGLKSNIFVIKSCH